MADSNTAGSKRSEEEGTKPPPKRARLSLTDVNELSKEELVARWKEHDEYLQDLEAKQALNSELAGLRESEEKLKLQQQESTRRENVLVMRLATKEQEMQDLLTQIQELKEAQNPSTIQLRKTLLDPAVNLLFQQMKHELDESKQKLEQAQSDLSAWKFTADSVTGKKLMAKCRKLIQENQELGRQLSQGRVAQLEAELSLQEKYSEEMKSSQDELNDFVIQLDEEVEGMQSTILTLQQQLKDTKQQCTQNGEQSSKLNNRIKELETEVLELRRQIKESQERHEVLTQERTESFVENTSMMDTEQTEETTNDHEENCGNQGEVDRGEDSSATECTDRGEDSPTPVSDNGECVQVNGERTRNDLISINASQTSLFTISKILETDENRTENGGGEHKETKIDAVIDKLESLKEMNKLDIEACDALQYNGEVVTNDQEEREEEGEKV